MCGPFTNIKRADTLSVGEMTSPRFGDREDVGILNGTLTPIFFLFPRTPHYRVMWLVKRWDGASQERPASCRVPSMRLILRASRL